LHRPSERYRVQGGRRAVAKGKWHGNSAARVAGEIDALQQFFAFFPTRRKSWTGGKKRVTRYGVSSRQTHDAHLVWIATVI
jgi:hypothetical protein